VGNSVIVFEVMCNGVHSALRLYMRPHRNLQAIYGDNYYPKELLVSSSATQSDLVDVVLCRWYEGETLQCKIEQWSEYPTKMAALSSTFETLAISLLREPWAHGDIKPENIIVDKRDMHLIDYDAMFCPGFTADDCIDIGTSQFQHPLRNEKLFDRSIDDYPIALIATVLAAMSLDSRLGRRLQTIDYMLISPSRAVAGRDEMLEYVENLFAEAGDARHYRIARLLRSPRPSLPQLKSLLEGVEYIVDESSQELISEYINESWGYTQGGKVVIPPYYDIAFDFSEGLGLVRIADVWHFIDPMGRVVITCGRGSGIKPFCNGFTRMKRDDGDVVIYRDGRIEIE
jgi:serine/threonine protein kinase